MLVVELCVFSPVLRLSEVYLFCLNKMTSVLSHFCLFPIRISMPFSSSLSALTFRLLRWLWGTWAQSRCSGLSGWPLSCWVASFFDSLFHLMLHSSYSHVSEQLGFFWPIAMPCGSKPAVLELVVSKGDGMLVLSLCNSLCSEWLGNALCHSFHP